MQFTDSDLHSRIADIARFLEKNVPGKYAFMDSGTTLEIESDALMQCRWSDRWEYLTQRYEEVGCYLYCPNEQKVGGSVMNDSFKEAAEIALTNAGVPVQLASQCAEIVARDDASKPNLGRSEDDQHLINSSMEWMKAKGFFER